MRKRMKLKTHPPNKIVFVGFITLSLIVLFSRNISRASLASVDSMDKYVTTVKKQKIIGRSRIVETLCDIVTNKGTICLYGGSGVGKSYIVYNTVQNYIELQSEHFRCSSDTLDRLKYSTTNVIIDENDMDNVAWNILSTMIKSGTKPSQGALILTAPSIKNIDFCDCIYVPPLEPHYITELGGDLSRYKDGNIRNCMVQSDQRDMFVTPKDRIYTLLSSETDALSLDDYDDYGYTWSVIHENYYMSKSKCLHSISESLSIADIYDTQVYMGQWDLLPYTCFHGINIPLHYVEGNVEEDKIRPGSSWTKYNNYKMRHKKYKTIRSNNRFMMDVDAMTLMLKKGDFDGYTIRYGDLDTINHLCLENKLKPKHLQKLKNALRNEEKARGD